MLFKFGNHKLGDDTVIFNMGTAKDCPSRQLGLCKPVNEGVKCYAEKAEIQYKQNVINSRLAQEAYWKSTTSATFVSDITRSIKGRRKETLYFRFNEAGDFYCQSDIGKLNYISECLREIGVTTYGYTARSDLDFSTRSFLCKGSGFNSGSLTGSTTVINKDDPVPEGYIQCPGSCKTCNLCKCNHPFNIAFRKH